MHRYDSCHPQASSLLPAKETLLTYWTAVIIACLGSLRTLFTQDDQSLQRVRKYGISSPRRTYPRRGLEDTVHLKSLEQNALSLEDERNTPVPYPEAIASVPRKTPVDNII